VTSPLATAATSGNFDLLLTGSGSATCSRSANASISLVELGRDKAEYDFGRLRRQRASTSRTSAIAAELAALSRDQGARAVRRPRRLRRGSVDLARAALRLGTEVSAGLRFYFFEDLGSAWTIEAAT